MVIPEGQRGGEYESACFEIADEALRASDACDGEDAGTRCEIDGLGVIAAPAQRAGPLSQTKRRHHAQPPGDQAGIRRRVREHDRIGTCRFGCPLPQTPGRNDLHLLDLLPAHQQQIDVALEREVLKTVVQDVDRTAQARLGKAARQEAIARHENGGARERLGPASVARRRSDPSPPEPVRRFEPRRCLRPPWRADTLG